MTECEVVLKGIISRLQKTEPKTSMPVLVVRALVQFTEESKANTYAEYSCKLSQATQILKEDFMFFAGVDLFTKLLSSLDNVDEFKNGISKKAEDFEQEYKRNLDKCVSYGQSFIGNDQTILLHSLTPLTLTLLLKASSTVNFRLVITTQNVNSLHQKDLEKELQNHHIPYCFITSASIGFCMEKIDFCLVGADVVTRNGGILNKVGTLPIAIVAKQSSKPFYCIVERYNAFN
jgi:translation initiation factor eIF-2B subunit alpha